MYAPSPWYSSIHFATAMFSVPWSPLILRGIPCWVLSRKSCSTVSAWLLLCTLAPVMYCDFPSRKRCVIILYLIRPAAVQAELHAQKWKLTMLSVVMPERVYTSDIVSLPLDESTAESLRGSIDMKVWIHDSRSWNKNALTLQVAINQPSPKSGKIPENVLNGHVKVTVWDGRHLSVLWSTITNTRYSSIVLNNVLEGGCTSIKETVLNGSLPHSSGRTPKSLGNNGGTPKF